MKRFTVTFFVRSSSDIKDKKIKIRVRLSFGRTNQQTCDSRLLVKLGEWDPVKQRARQSGDVKANEDINDTLNKLRDKLEGLIRAELKKGVVAEDWLEVAIDKYYNPQKYEEKRITLFSFIQEFIDKAESRINPKTGKTVSYKMVREYERTFHYLKQYAETVKREPDFQDIDLDFYDSFVTFLQSTFRSLNKKENGKPVKYKLATNTIGKKIQTLKIFMNDATERGINTNLKFKSSKFISVTEEAETFALNENELNQFYMYDFSKNERLEKVRDLFIVGCWTGLRFSDLSQLRAKDIKNGFFHITQQKTGGKVVIPVHPVVQEILNKYEGELPKSISNQKFNDYLQEAAEIAEINGEFHKGITRGGQRISKKYKKFELLTTHAARRSFATNLYKSGFPTNSIMAITGHKTEAAFLKYLKVTPEEHAKLLQEYWLKQMNHLKVVS